MSDGKLESRKSRERKIASLLRTEGKNPVPTTFKALRAIRSFRVAFVLREEKNSLRASDALRLSNTPVTVAPFRRRRPRVDFVFELYS